MRYMLGIICLLGMTGCSPDPVLRGNFVDISLLKDKEGKLSKDQIEEMIGAPAFVDPTNPYKFFYTGSKGTRYTFFIETTDQVQTISIEYDAAGVLKKVTPIKESSV